MTRPASKRARHARPRLLAGTSVALAGIGTAAVLVLSAASSPPAFAVSRNADGTYTVRLQKLAAIHGANAKLAALGIRARIVEVTPSCAYRVLPPAAVHAMELAKGIAASDALEELGGTRVDPRRIPRGASCRCSLPYASPATSTSLPPGWPPSRRRHASAPFRKRPSPGVPRAPPSTSSPLRLRPPTAGRSGAPLGKTSATVHLPTGNSGNSGNSGKIAAAGSDHTQAPAKNPPNWVVIGCQVRTSPPPAPSS